MIDLIMVLKEKEQKINAWLKREKALLTEEDEHVIEILGVEVIAVTILRVIAN